MKCCKCKKDLTGKPKYYLERENRRFKGTYKELKDKEAFCLECAKKETTILKGAYTQGAHSYSYPKSDSQHSDSGNWKGIVWG